MTQAGRCFADPAPLLLLLLCQVLAPGQTIPHPPGPPTIHVISDLIEVPVLAFRTPFREAPALNRNDFVIRLDGGPSFQPSYVRREGPEPLTLSILVETETHDASAVSQALRTAVQAWKPTLLSGSDRLSIYVYGCRIIRSLQEMSVDLGARREEIMNALSLPRLQAAMADEKSCRPSPPDRSLEAVINEMAKTATWKIILLILNGEHKVDTRSIQKVQSFAASEGVTLFAIKYLRNGSFPASVYSDTEGINVLVSSLGGVTMPSSLDDLGEVTGTIIERIRQRYILSFPRPGNGTAGVHRLEITSTRRDVRIVASATAAPLLDNASCISDPDTWLCSQQRPQYGTASPPIR